MKPQIAVDITARDKTASGRRSAEQGFAGTAKKTSAFAKDSGFAALEKKAKGFSDLAKRGFGLDVARRDVAAAADQVQRLADFTGTAITKVSGLAAASTGMDGLIGGLAKTGGLIGSALAAATAIGTGVFIAGSKFADSAAGIGRTARTLGETTDELQAARAANERYGVSIETTDAALESLGDTLHSARFGRNNEALGVLRQLGVQMKLTKDGGVDVNAMFYDLAGAIAKIANPQTQKVVASMFGLAGALPAIRQGGAALKAQAESFAKSGAGLQAKDIGQASDFYTTVKTAQQEQIGKLTKAAGLATLGPARAELDGFIHAFAAADRVVEATPKTFSDLTKSAQSLALNGFHAAEGAAKSFARSALDFAARIEQRESRGRQFDKSGSPLTSPKGAIGAMQMLESTARATARRHGVRWDPERFRRDKGYNEQLGGLHLADLAGRYGGDETLSAAAYNAGEGNVDKWIKRFGDPRTGAISDADFARKIPFKETRDYVDNVTRVQVDVAFRNAPPGTVARASGDKGVQVKAHVARSMDGAG